MEILVRLRQWPLYKRFYKCKIWDILRSLLVVEYSSLWAHTSDERCVWLSVRHTLYWFKVNDRRITLFLHQLPSACHRETPLATALNETVVNNNGEKTPISDFASQYLANGVRYDLCYYWPLAWNLHIGYRLAPWPWKTHQFNTYRFFQSPLCKIERQYTVDPYCQRQKDCIGSIDFSDVQVMHRFAEGHHWRGIIVSHPRIQFRPLDGFSRAIGLAQYAQSHKDVGYNN